jgi:hypothetical protein
MKIGRKKRENIYNFKCPNGTVFRRVGWVDLGNITEVM